VEKPSKEEVAHSLQAHLVETESSTTLPNHQYLTHTKEEMTEPMVIRVSSKVTLTPIPVRFNGDKKKYKSWKNSVKEYFLAYAANFGELGANVANIARKEHIRTRISFILALMKAEDDTVWTSLTWAKNDKLLYWKEEECILNWEMVPMMVLFWELLDELFADASEKKLAQVKLEHFYQGKLDFPMYIQQFEILVNQAGYVMAGTNAHNQNKSIKKWWIECIVATTSHLHSMLTIS
jgi:hypothetical protein